MEIQHPKQSPVIPQWDLGIVLHSLKSPPFEPLKEADFKHLSYKTVFLVALASGGRRSELQALMFAEKYCQFAPQGAKATLFFNPSFIPKNQRPSETNAPLIIPALPTGHSQFGHPNCPVRALRIYHRRSSDPDLRRGRERLFIPLKDVKKGVEVSSATISRWICSTISLAHELSYCSGKCSTRFKST